MSAHRHFDADTGEEIVTLVDGCYRCALNREEAADHAAENIADLEADVAYLKKLLADAYGWVLLEAEDAQEGSELDTLAKDIRNALDWY